jgi:RNA polymerase sigma-70 factor (sigma-E family)
MTKPRDDRESLFRAFFDTEGERLRRLALFLTGDPERAKDLAQEAMVRVYRHWRRIENQDPGPYARRILVNLVRSEHRRSLLQKRHESSVVDRSVDPTARVDESSRLTTALKELSPMRRAVVVLRFYEDMTEAEIARVLDRPLGTVKSDLHRALKLLRPLLESDLRSEEGTR